MDAFLSVNFDEFVSEISLKSVQGYYAKYRLSGVNHFSTHVFDSKLERGILLILLLDIYWAIVDPFRISCRISHLVL